MVRLALVTSVMWRPVSFHGAEQHLAPLRRRPGAVHMIQQPADLRAGEVGRQRQAAAVAEPVLPGLAAELADQVGGAGVLPDDGVVDRPAGGLVPQDGGLALVGDANGRQILGRDLRLGQGAGDDRLHIGPDLLGVVLHPAGPREDLPVLLLVRRHDGAGGVEDDTAGGGGALVDGGDVAGHAVGVPLASSPGEAGLLRAGRTFGLCPAGLLCLRRAPTASHRRISPRSPGFRRTDSGADRRRTEPAPGPHRPPSPRRGGRRWTGLAPAAAAPGSAR